jgi:hypothetical protein
MWLRLASQSADLRFFQRYLYFSEIGVNAVPHVLDRYRNLNSQISAVIGLLLERRSTCS